MYNSLFMAVGKSLNDRSASFSCLLLTEEFFLKNLIEQLSTLHELHNKAPMSLILKHIDQLNNIRVINLFKNINFSLHG